MAPAPILRGALVRGLRAPAWAGLLVLATALLVASLAAPALFARAAHDAALQRIRAAAEDDTFRIAPVDLRASWGGRLGERATADLRADLDALPGFGPAEVTSFATGPNRVREPVLLSGGRSAVGTLWARDGALEALGGDPADSGVWVPAEVAEDLGVVVGDTVRVAARRLLDGSVGRKVPLEVLGTFDPAPGSPLPPQVLALGVRRVDLPLADADVPGSALLVTDRNTLERTSLRIGDVPRHVADLPLAPDLSPDAAARAARAQDALQAEAFRLVSPLANDLAQARPVATQLQLASGLPEVLDDAEEVLTASRAAVAPFARATQAMALLLLLAVHVLWARSRAAESWTLTEWGLGPPRRGVLAGLEVLPPAVVAAPLGAGLALAGVALAGPPGRLGVRESLAATATTCAVASLLVVLGAVVLATAAALQQEREAARGPRHQPVRVPWGLAWFAAAVVVGVAVLTLDVDERATSPLAAAFPLAVAAGVAVVVMWLAALLPRPRLGREGSLLWLALRRSGATTGAATAVLAIGLTVLGYGLAVRDGVGIAVADKAAALTGAATRVDVGEQLVGRRTGEAASLAGPGSVVVYRRGVSLPPAFGEQPLLMADPADLAAVVDWGATLDEPGRAALEEMAVAGGPDDPVPVVLAGTTDARRGDPVTLTFNSSVDVDAVVVAAVEAFPGSESEDGAVTVVAPTRQLVRALPRAFAPSTPFDQTLGAGVFSASVWSSESSTAVQQRLRDVGLESQEVTLLAASRARPELLSASWAVGYLVPLGLAAACLVAATGLLLARRLLERDRVPDVLLRHMGWSWRSLTLSRTGELVAAIALAVLAAGLATTVLVLGPTVVETSAQLPPLARPALSADGLVWWVASWLLVLLAAVLALASGGGRRRAGEVLRDQR